MRSRITPQREQEPGFGSKQRLKPPWTLSQRTRKAPARHPQGGAPTLKATRSMLSKGFPFNLVYRYSGGELLVVAVAPHRRKPGYWCGRLTAG